MMGMAITKKSERKSSTPKIRASSFILYIMNMVESKMIMFTNTADTKLHNLWFVFFRITTDPIVEITREKNIIT